MHEFSLPALVIRETDIGEQDKLLTLLSAEKGRFGAKVHGARNIKSKNMACSSLFCYGNFTCSEKNGRITVKESTLQESFFDLRLDMQSLAIANYIAEVLCTVSTEESEETDLMVLALNTLFALNKGDKQPALIKAVFELRCLALLGFCPDLSACEKCGKKNGQPFYLDLTEGTLLCQDCRNLENRHGSLYILHADTLAAMQYILNAPPKRIFSFILGQRALSSLCEIAERYLITQTETNYKSLKFYHSMEF